ncbi:MAG: ShlB/FhaC/HecB family hemolysin secretion/activation protein [Chlorobium sp.]|nr:ShlB/FhaC/HecB family hemolysin secretion/activation protein [Chlorobium sp.]
MKKIGIPLLFVISIFPHTLFAAPPDAGSLMREIERKPATPPEQIPEKLITPVRPPEKDQQGAKIMVKGFRITGATIFSESELQNVLEPFTGRELGLDELNQATNMLAAYYTAKGYIAQVLLPPQEIKDGIVTIKVIEGKLGAVEVTPATGVRFSEERAAKTITGNQTVGEPIRIEAVEKGLLLLNDNPGIAASATLQPGTEPGTTDLMVKLDKTPLLTGSIDFDNSGNVSTGEYRITPALKINNPGGFGDQISLKGLTSIGDTYGRAEYSVPLGTRGTRIGASLSGLQYELGGDFESLNARGNAFTAGANMNTPFIRKRSGNLYNTVGYEYREYEDNALGSNLSKKNIHAGMFGFSGDRRDSFFGGGYTILWISATLGNLDLSGNLSDEASDQAGPNAAGFYSKSVFNLLRIQNIYGEKTSFHLLINGQIANDNLDSSEKISLGGPFAVRALPPNEGSGDEGLIVTGEIHQNLIEQLQIFGFYDFGWIRQHHDTYPGWYTIKGAPNTYDVDGIGLGLVWTKPGSWSIKGTVAQSLETNPAMTANGKDSDGTLREPRFWIQATYYF